MPEQPSPVSLHVAPEALTPLVRKIVAEALAQLESARATVRDRLAFGEAEAAALLGLAPHQLRDERLRGRVKASVGPGKKILYTRAQLTEYLTRREWKPGEGNGSAPH
jgi:hypothetical protein